MPANMVTPELIKSKVKHVSYTRLPDSTVTICHLVLENGFSVRGESACVDPANYDQVKSENYAYEEAFNKIWVLEGYLMKERMFQAQANVEKLARTCHEINKLYCESNGDLSQPDWANAPDWQKDSARNGVRAHLSQDLSPEDSHVLWMRQKLAEGWVYGDEKNPVLKTHPCLVPYSMLPEKQQVKDKLFSTIVKNLKD